MLYFGQIIGVLKGCIPISKGLDQTAFIALKNELNLVQGKVEGEVTAFLEHLGKDQGFSDE